MPHLSPVFIASVFLFLVTFGPAMVTHSRRRARRKARR
jgi:hypothetical protein